MNAQQLFFDQIKLTIPSNISLVEVISNLLNISDDSVYRRIRGEKELSFTELQLLATHYNISIDSILSLKNDQLVLFKDFRINQNNFTFEQYLTSLIETLNFLRKTDNLEIIYSAKDFPIFHYFLFPKLAAFKLFFWQKSILNFDSFKSRQFSKDANLNELEIGKLAMLKYYKLPGIEIWGEEIIHSSLRQIEFYHESGFFKCTEDIIEILDEMEKMLMHLQSMASSGNKFIGENPDKDGGSFQLYFNEMILGNNSLLVRSGATKTVYLTYNELNYISTMDENFCQQYYQSLKTLISKSSLISTASEKIRNMFFNKLFKKLNDTRKKVGV